MDVIFMLWLRQLKRYGRAPVRIIAMVAQPMLFLLTLGVGFSPVFSKAGAGDYFAFLAPGAIGAGILFNAVFSGVDLLTDRQLGFIKEALAAPVPRFQIMLGRALGAATVAVLQGVLITLVCIVAGFRPHALADLPMALAFAVLLAVLFALLGSILGSVLKDNQAFNLIVNFIVTPIFYLSGAIFPLTGLPPLIRGIALANPLTFAIEGLRGTLTDHWTLGLPISLTVLLTLNAVALMASTAAFSRIKP